MLRGDVESREHVGNLAHDGDNNKNYDDDDDKNYGDNGDNGDKKGLQQQRQRRRRQMFNMGLAKRETSTWSMQNVGIAFDAAERPHRTPYHRGPNLLTLSAAVDAVHLGWLEPQGVVTVCVP